ncbi:MAG: GGDEF domain-containing protein [Lachnospiraceae bacterium]|jgi:diguanylate cyclase (GGDEF)-like protein|nr:GGDEF domain-containing protein [Lachnospiraceae bacterium]MCI9099879.1 GGDEF domain-containing protein [Lachnospiraceae bacterium]MCI9358113.1 GGDEF domain-containing protein [Lachnospiraceae bacterium]
MKEKKTSIKAMRIRTLNFVMILLSCVLYIFLILATVHISTRCDHMLEATNKYIACQENAALVSEASDDMTEYVRLYVITEEAQYIDAYFEEVDTARRRERALEQQNEEHVSDKANDFLQKALDWSNQLMEKEIYAMKLTASACKADIEKLPPKVQEAQLSEADTKLGKEKKLEKAMDMVFGFEYQDTKKQIRENVEYFLNDAVDWTQKAQADSVWALKRTMTQQKIFISILFVQNIITFILIICLIVKPLQVYVKCIREEKRLEITGSYEFQYLALTYNDIYEINAANEAMLRHQAEHDPLTGIMNRGAFEHLKQQLKASAKPLALLLVDVDKFKLINDGYGHETGDLILKKVANLLVENFRVSDYPARIGGDEFAVIMTDVTADMQSVIEGKIYGMNHVLQNPTDGLPKISLSVGAAFSDNGFTDELYALTDSALYQVKEHGRCGCRFYKEKE